MRRFIMLAALVVTQAALAQCKIDFNNDGVFPSEQDTTDFLAVLAGGDCSTGNCDSIDFNANGVFPEDQDVTDFYAVLAGGPCSNGGWTPSRTSGPVLTVGPRDTIAAVYARLQWSGGTVRIPYASREGGVYNEAIKWHDLDGLPYGNVVFEGVPGPEGQRPIIRPPATSSAGVRVKSANVTVRGVQIECAHCEAGVDITGDALNTLIEDVVIIGPAIGVRIQGDNINGGPVRIRRSIIRDTLGGAAHSQGVYVSGWRQMVLVQGCVFYNIGEETTFNQGIYSVHGPGVRIFTDSWFFDPGFAGIQARGSNDEYTITGNVFEQCGNGFGVGHPMGRVYPVKGLFARNLIIRPKRPFWGIALQNGDGATVTENIMLASGAGYAFQIENPSRSLVVKGNTISRWDRVRNYASGVSASNDGIDWQGDEVTIKAIPTIAWPALLDRKAGVWDESQHGTTGVIERAK
jgi:hypothetical protein